MNTLTKLLVPLIVCFALTATQAQEVKNDSIKNAVKTKIIERLNTQKVGVKNQEKEQLKQKIEAINKRLDKGEITAETAQKLKEDAATLHAKNIENRLAIINNKIELAERNSLTSKERDSLYFGIFKISAPNIRAKNTKKDIRTTEDIVFAIGFNNTIIDGQSLNDSPYKIGGSGFVELGWAWKTRIFKNTNFWRINYGASIQWNKLDIKNNQYFVNNNGTIELQEFPENLNKAKFRTTNLVFPVHIEFGPSKKIERKNYFRYSTVNKLKIGLGGYAGLNISSLQKLKYKQDGNRVKDKQKGRLEVNEFVYGLSGYISWGSVALYAKYDLNPLFKNQAIAQNNISLGVRFDMD